MENQTYGYIRVSSRDQREDRQRIAMRETGVSEENIHMDKLSGKDFDRPGYRHVLKKLKPDDTLIIKSIDGWAATMTKYWSSGVLSQRRGMPPLSCWICRCSIRGKGAILRGR